MNATVMVISDQEPVVAFGPYVEIAGAILTNDLQFYGFDLVSQVIEIEIEGASVPD